MALFLIDHAAQVPELSTTEGPCEDLEMLDLVTQHDAASEPRQSSSPRDQQAPRCCEAAPERSESVGICSEIRGAFAASSL